MRIMVNGSPRDVPDLLSVAELLRTLQVPARHVAVEVNRELVPREVHEKLRLAAGDHVEIVTLVGGG